MLEMKIFEDDLIKIALLFQRVEPLIVILLTTTFIDVSINKRPFSVLEPAKYNVIAKYTYSFQ